MKIKKALINLLCTSLVLGNLTPAFAAVSDSESNTYQNEVNETKETEVLYTRSASYFVTIPKRITLGSDKASQYSVKVEGDIPSDKEVYVSPIDSIAETDYFDFYMKDQSKNNPKADVVAAVTQSKFYWNFQDTADGYTETNNQIIAENLTAGNWKGIFDFEINMHNVTADEPEVEPHEHNYVENSGIIASWENTSNDTYAFIQDGTKWISNNQGIESSIATSVWTVDVTEDTEYTFKYQVSSESGCDTLTITLDDVVLVDAVSGLGDEETYTTTLSKGTHILTAAYEKDVSVDDNDDCGYVILEDVTGCNHKCTICNKTESHKLKQTVVKEAICIEAGEIIYTCDECGYSYSEEIEALGEHHFVDGVCTMCGYQSPDLMVSEATLDDWNYTLNDTDGTVTLNYYIGKAANVIVSNSYDIGTTTYQTRLASNTDYKRDSYMFAGRSDVKSIIFNEGIDTSNLTGTVCMFWNCSSLTDLDIENLDTNSVTDMKYMFCDCTSLRKVNFNSLDTSNVTDMYGMFWGFGGLDHLDLSGFNTENVTNMGNMFYDSSLKTIDLSNFDTSNVMQMDDMFGYCNSLTGLDLSNFDTSNVTTMESMFYNSPRIESVNMSGWDISKLETVSNMFQQCYSLKSVDVSNWHNAGSTPITMDRMFWYCSSLESIDMSTWNISNITDMRLMFSASDFYRGSSLSEVKFGENIDTSSVTDMVSMFGGCSSLKNLDLGNFNTSNVIDMSSMFNGCSSLTDLDISSFDTNKVTEMTFMFSDCSSLTDLDVSSFDTSKVTEMYSMFDGCSSLATLDVSSFNTSNVTRMDSMFNGCSSLTAIYVTEGKWLTEQAYIGSMFYNCGTSSVTYK